jgi:uncharacterized protein YndB with AHSA1/START domain
MAKSIFGYVIYIAATPGAVWKALLDGEFTRQYWGGDNGNTGARTQHDQWP